MPQRHLLFIARHPECPSTRYRAATWLPWLREAGWAASLRFPPRDRGELASLLQAARRADVCVVVRKLSATLWRRVRSAARHLVVDFDDALFCRDDGSTSFLRRRRFANVLRSADGVWAGNGYLAEFARAAGQSRVAIVPTSVDPDDYPAEPDRKPRASPDGDALRLVWIGSSATRPYLEAVVPQLEALVREGVPLRLKIVSDFDLDARELPTSAVRWSAETESHELATADVGLAPMPENAWTRGKCGLKALQYMAAGLPVIASNAGVHREIVVPDRTGLLVGPGEWGDAVARLADDAGLRERMGIAGRQRVASRYARKAVFRTIWQQLERFEGRRVA